MASPWWSSSSWLFTKLAELKRSAMPLAVMKQALMLMDKRTVETEAIPEVHTHVHIRINI